MRYVPQKEAIKKVSSPSCVVYEYPTGSADITIAVAEISGRYPEKGYALNRGCTEMGYVLSGMGFLVTEIERVSLGPGDVVYIPSGEQYYWEGTFTVVLPTSPAWHPEQHEIVMPSSAQGAL